MDIIILDDIDCSPSPVRSLTRKLTGLSTHVSKRRLQEDAVHSFDEEPKPIIDVKPDIKRARPEYNSAEDDKDEESDEVRCLSASGWKAEFKKPNRRCFSFTGLMSKFGSDRSSSQLKGTFIRDFTRGDPHGFANRPLGIAYDEVAKIWIVADSGANAVRLLSKNSERGTYIAFGLRCPSAVVVVDPGHGAAVLGDHGINIIRYSTNEMMECKLAEWGPDVHCRGLGFTTKGEVVTIEQPTHDKPMAQFRFYKLGGKFNELTKTVPYLIENRPRERNDRPIQPKPCFLDIAKNGKKDRVVVTDLGCDLLTIYNLDPKKRTFEIIEQRNIYGKKDENFEYISGAKFDTNCDLFITDAAGRNLKLMDQRGKFLQKVKFDSSFPYVSNFCCNSKNELLVCDRKQGRLILYAIEGGDSIDHELNRWI